MPYRFPVFVLLFFCFTVGARAAELTVNKIAAVVNGDMITMHELRRHTMVEMARRNLPPTDPRIESIQKDVLDNLVNDILIRQEAKRFKVSVSDSEVEGELQNTIARSGMPPEKFYEALKKDGMSKELLKERLGNTLLRQRMANYMVVRKVFVTPEEIADYYAKHKSEMKGSTIADFSILLLPEKLPIKNIYEQLRSGSLKFEDAARQYSADKSGKEGGRISGAAWEKLPPDMHKLLSLLKDGQMSPLLRTEGGAVVIRRNSVTEGAMLSLQEASPRIEDILRAPLLEERLKEYTSQLRSKAVIDIRL